MEIVQKFLNESNNYRELLKIAIQEMKHVHGHWHADIISNGEYFKQANADVEW